MKLMEKSFGNDTSNVTIKSAPKGRSFIMMNIRHLAIVFAFLCLSSAAFAQTSSAGPISSSSNSTETNKFLPLSEVREGMRGTARTVFRGTEPEEFSVEILGVVPGGIGPKQDMIVGRISGGQADRTAVFAGMSGSPVYINGKLIGAISYSFPFAKEAICGITPIDQMIAIFEKSEPKQIGGERTAFSFSEIAAVEPELQLPFSQEPAGIVTGMRSNSLLAAVAGQTFRPIATPLSFNGFTQKTLDAFAPQLIRAGLLPVASVGGSSPITKLKQPDENTLTGGDSVVMQLARGDYSMAAAGTVTYRNGERIYAFGHPFLGLGMSDLPMSESHVVTVIPNLNNSFKLAVPDAMVGTMTQDRATGVFGKLGQAPKMIPVNLEMRTSLGKKVVANFEVARDTFLTPMLLNMAIFNTGTAEERGLGDTTVRVVANVKLRGTEPLHIERRFSGSQAAAQASAAVAMPFVSLFRSGFENLDIEKIDIRLFTDEGSRTAVLERISVDKAEAAPGEIVNVKAFARTNTGRVVMETIPVTIPKDASEGELTLAVSDGSTVQKKAASQHFVPETLSDLVETMNSVKRSDLLYLRLVRSSKGAIIGSNELPDLPPSVLATLGSGRNSGGVKPSVESLVLEQEIDPSEFLITGEQTLTLHIVH